MQDVVRCAADSVLRVPGPMSNNSTVIRNGAHPFFLSLAMFLLDGPPFARIRFVPKPRRRR